MLSIIKPKFTLFQVQIKGIFRDTFKLCQSGFCQSPKVFDTVDMIMPIRKLILSMLDTMMSTVAKINQSIIGFKSIGINNRIFTDMIFYDWIKLLNRTIFNHLSIDLSLSLNQSEYDLFTSCSATSDATNSFRAKVALIQLDAALSKDALLFTNGRNLHSKSLQKPINGVTAESGQFGNFDCFNIAGEKAN